MQTDVFPIRLIHPSTMIVIGPSGIGKSEFVLDLISHKDTAYSQHIDEVYYLCNNFQSRFVDFSSAYPWIYFIQTLDEIPFDNKQCSMLIVYDEKLLEFQKNKSLKNHIEDMFIRTSRHSNISCIVILQTLFGTGWRTIANNSTYTVIFDSPRNKQELGYLCREMYPGSK
jgi:hypothetical protein